MKKSKAVFLLAMLSTLLLFSLSTAKAEDVDYIPKSDFVFPASLRVIEEEAFFGVSVKTVVFPDGFSTIGNKAFENADQLSDAYIPATTEYIADSAFPANPRFVIHGVKGSYAQEWAEKHRVPFKAEDIWKHILDNGRVVGVPEMGFDFLHRTVNPDKVIQAVSRGEKGNESKRPQDRPELNPIDYRFP